jgi:HD-GYP domain-containing protein (c-di-GMP phosphodiesterase class II)
MDVILPDQLPDLLVAQGDGASVTESVSKHTGLARFSQQLRALSSLNTRLICMETEKPVYDEMVRGVGRVLNTECCALFLQGHGNGDLKLVGLSGATIPQDERKVSLADIKQPVVQAYLEEYMIHLPDLAAVEGIESLLDGCRSLLALPIMGREGPVGVFEFGRRAAGEFSTEDIDLAGMLVDQMAYQLENYRLVRQLSASRDAVIHGMARLAESRGGDIGGHLERICAYSQLLGRRLLGRPGYLSQVSDEWITTLTRAAALHDIGKVGVPDRILLKPGSLDEEEFRIMRTHSTLGAEILQDLMLTHGAFSMLEMGMQIAESHHERWDGSGYPHGLSGYEIPLCARIVALADVYDALTSKRVYKTAWSCEETLTQIENLAGSHFDPDLVPLFLQDAAELERICHEYPD